MGERTGFWTTLREMIEQGAEPEAAVRSLMDNPDYRENVVAILAGHARGQVIRKQTREAEHLARIALDNKDLSGAQSALAAQTFPRLGARKELVGKSFPTSSGHLVQWTEATAEDHRNRAFWFRRQADTYAKTASLHELAAQLIEDAGVSCLAEVRSVEKWPELAAMVADALPAGDKS